MIDITQKDLDDAREYIMTFIPAACYFCIDMELRRYVNDSIVEYEKVWSASIVVKEDGEKVCYRGEEGRTAVESVEFLKDEMIERKVING